MTSQSEDPSPGRKRRAERAARAVLKFVGGAVRGIASNVLIVLPTIGVVTIGGVALSLSGIAHIVALALLAALLGVCGIVLRRARVGRRTKAEQERSATLRDQLEAAQELIELKAAQVADQADALRRQAEELNAAGRWQTYLRFLLDAARGLLYALQYPDRLPNDMGIRDFIESNFLRAGNATFARAIAADGNPRPRIEAGIARHTGAGMTVTHASGPYTQALRDRGACFTGDHTLEEVLRDKAADDFSGGDYYVAPITRVAPGHSVFALSTAPLTTPEREALDLLVTLIEIATKVLGNLPLE